jgi:membrane protease YdiL (CAAX protease family)
MTAALAPGDITIRPAGPLQVLRRHPLVSYFVIAFACTWAYDLLFLVRFPLPDFPGRSTPRDFGPTLAALIMTAVTGGKPGLRDLRRRLLLWRVPARWYLVVFLGVPALFTLGIALVPGALASLTVPSPADWLLYPGVVFFLFVLVFGGPLFEEPGWRGFALPRLQARWGPVAGSVILGLLWACWHATEYLTPEFAAANGGLTPRGVGVFALGLISFSVVVTWVFNHTRTSVFIAILLHTALNWSQGLAGALFPAAGANELGPLVTFGLAALVLVVATRGRLGYPGPGGGAARGRTGEPAVAGRAGAAEA